MKLFPLSVLTTPRWYRRTTVTSDERWKVYNDVRIDVAMLQEVHANEGSDYVAVVNYAKMWTMIGKFLADGDQVR